MYFFYFIVRITIIYQKYNWTKNASYVNIFTDKEELKDKKAAYENCIRNGDEGVVFKHLKSKYKLQNAAGNKISDWIKFKPAEKW